jgi:3-hydroxyisobutyrate dehydrogenase
MGIRTVGVVGLGNMGLGMAASLVRAGFAVLGQDINTVWPEAAKAAKAAKAAGACWIAPIARSW